MDAPDFHTENNLNVSEWWKDKAFVAELERRYKALEDGTDKGYTIEQLEVSIEKLRDKK